MNLLTIGGKGSIKLFFAFNYALIFFAFNYALIFGFGKLVKLGLL